MRKQLMIFIVVMLMSMLFTGLIDVASGQTHLDYVSGDNQAGLPGRALQHPLKVAVFDSLTNRVQDFPVTFEVTEGGGKLNGVSESLMILTDQDGYAQVTLTLGPRHFSINQVLAYADGLTGSPIIFTAISKAGELFGNALHLNGSQQYFEIPDADFLNIDSTKECTIEFWFNQNVSQKVNLINKWINYDEALYRKSQGWFASVNIAPFHFHPDSMYDPRQNPFDGTYQSGFLMIKTNYTYDTNRSGGHSHGRRSSLGTGVWNHIAFKFFKNMDIHIYLNGSYFSDCSYKHGDIGTPGIPLNIGGLAPAIDSTLDTSIYLNGLIDEVRIWNKALSASQIQANLKDTLGAEYYSSPGSGLVAYYRFEKMENLGVGDDDLANDIRDLSYNANHGNVVGGAVIYQPNSTGITEFDVSNVPDDYILLQNYPNPFNSSTTFRYQLPKSTFVTLKVYNTVGQEIGTLVNGLQPAGLNEVIWNANDLPSGIYIYRLETKEFVKTSKMLLQK